MAGEENKKFGCYCEDAVRRFLKSAVVIDDDIDSSDSSPVYYIKSPPPSFFGAPLEEESKKSDAPEATLPDIVNNTFLKPLTDAFLDEKIVCGVLNPTDSDDREKTIERIVTASETADIIIIDWYLRSVDQSITIEALGKILSKDRDRKERLRLVIVYTSAPPLEKRLEELKEALVKNGVLDILIDVQQITLTIGACRILFVEKSSPTSKNGVEPKDLPKLAIAAFTQQTSGLLPSFALSAIGALREATHHILARFDAKYDPAFVGHHMLTSSENAHSFALATLMMHVKAVLSLPHFLGQALSKNEVSAWFDENINSSELDGYLKDSNLNKEDLKKFCLGEEIFEGKKVPKFHKALFINSSDSEENICHAFSRFSDYTREFPTPKTLNPQWSPVLVLGSILKKYNNGAHQYYLCTQPMCDTVRISKKRTFSFVKLLPPDKKKNGSWIVVNEKIDTGYTQKKLRVGNDAEARYYDDFDPDEKRGIICSFENEEGYYYFTGSEDRHYQWVGDIDPMKAQKIAVDMASGLARVGLDEYEWLRQGGEL